MTNLSAGVNSCKIPSRPTELPYPPTEENIPKLERWLLVAFSETTFNVDAQQPG